MAQKNCYKDKTRKCDETCEAFCGNRMIYGPDQHGNTMTGTCLDIALKFQLNDRLLALVKELKK